MSTPSLDATIRFTGKEIFTAAEVPAADSETARTLKTGGQALSASLNSTTTAKVDKPPISLKITSTTTLDLTAIAALCVPTGGRTIDLTGAKLTAWFADAPNTNAALVNIKPAASDPYPFIGTANEYDVEPGETVGSSFKSDKASSKPAVSSTVKGITITITGSDVLYLDLYFGT